MGTGHRERFAPVGEAGSGGLGVITIDLAASWFLQDALQDAFTAEGFDVGDVGGFATKSLPGTLSLEVARFFIEISRRFENNAEAALEGAAFLAVLQKVGRAIKRFWNRHPGVTGELSVCTESSDGDETTGEQRYVLPTDPEELRLAIEALPQDMARTTGPSEKWWRHDHGWLTAEEGWRLDGYEGNL